MSYRGQISTIKEDTTAPIACIPIFDGERKITREDAKAFNRYLLTERESHGRRTRLKVTFEVWSRSKKRMEYRRLRQVGAVLCLPNSEQAEIAMNLIEQVCKSLDGKFLSK